MIKLIDGRPTVFVPLTRGLFAFIDPEDLEIVAPHDWHAKPWSNNSGKFYAARNIITEDGKKTTVTLHRFLLNAPRGVLVDHRNGNGLDCRRFNLRAATPAQNNANRRTRSSGWRGVRKVRGQWWAVIKEGEQQLKLGPFNSALAAAWAYNREATRIHGEFALLNKLNAWT